MGRFFRSWKSLLLAKILIVVGCIQLFFAWTYTGVAKRENTTVGVIARVDKGKSTTWVYQFKINGTAVRDDGGECRTALTPQGCVAGAAVLVYYDPWNLTETRLQEYGEASREKLYFGLWMSVWGILLIGLYFLLNRIRRGKEEPDEPEEETLAEDSEVLHIAPGE